MIQIFKGIAKSILHLSQPILVWLCVVVVGIYVINGGIINGDTTMDLEGFFRVDQNRYHLGDPIKTTLVLQNKGDSAAYLFVPRGRMDGIQISVKNEDGFRIKDMREEPDVGLVPEKRLPSGETYTQEYLLTQWLTFEEPGDYTVELAIEVETYNSSLHQQNQERVANSISISTDIPLTILP
jgi:hypothetical protein